MAIYLLDDMQLAVLKRVETRLYDEMHRLTADERRDLANAMDAVLHSVEQYGDVTDDLAKLNAMAKGGRSWRRKVKT